MNDNFTVRVGQTWQLQNKQGIDVTIEITDMYVSELIGHLSVVIRYDYTYGDEPTKHEIGFMELCEQLKAGEWKCVEAVTTATGGVDAN